MPKAKADPKVIHPRIREIAFVKIEDLAEVEDNPQEHRISDIKASILKAGFVEPIMVNMDNRIVGGHGRKTALLELIAEGYTLEDGLVPVMRGDFSEEEASGLLVALNMTAGRPNPQKLATFMAKYRERFGLDHSDVEWTGLTVTEQEDLDNLTLDMEDLQEVEAEEVEEDGLHGDGYLQVKLMLTPEQHDILTEITDPIMEDEPLLDKLEKQWTNPNAMANALTHLLSQIPTDE